MLISPWVSKALAQKTNSRTTTRLAVMIDDHDAVAALQMAATYFRQAAAETAEEEDDGDLAWAALLWAPSHDQRGLGSPTLGWPQHRSFLVHLETTRPVQGGARSRGSLSRAKSQHTGVGCGFYTQPGRLEIPQGSWKLQTNRWAG